MRNALPRKICPLAFDALHRGVSGGKPRFLDNPLNGIGDIYSAIDYMTSIPCEYAARTGALWMCAGSGTIVKAAMTERHMEALTLVSAVDVGAATRKRWVASSRNPKNGQAGV
jgi:hypothetical protein